MTTVKRPTRSFSFSDWTKSRPREPIPGDRLDSMFNELIEAIATTQDALAEIRQPGGTLHHRSIGPEHFKRDLIAEVTQSIGDAVEPVRAVIRHAADEVVRSEHNAALYAKDAEAAVNVAQQLTSGMHALRQKIESKADINATSVTVADAAATDAENWANYSQAQADNAIAAKNEALQWAEFLAGPVVDSAQAPAYIAGTPFPHGLYYQPVQGGVAGLWSAKWWALHAQNLVGTAGFYYLGAWDTPPLPGEQNPDTGRVVPNPLAPGTLYYNSSDEKLYLWDATGWVQPVAPVAAVTGTFVYVATANQTAFFGADSAGHAPSVGNSASDVFVNGVRLVAGSDYVVVGDTLTLNDPVAVNSMVQWDLLLSPSQLAPGSVNAWKMKPVTPDGATRDFTLQYVDGGATVNANVGDGVQLIVSLDGVIQESGADYTASGNSIHFIVAPDITAHIWIVWYQPGAPA